MCGWCNHFTVPGLTFCPDIFVLFRKLSLHRTKFSVLGQGVYAACDAEHVFTASGLALYTDLFCTVSGQGVYAACNGGLCFTVSIQGVYAVYNGDLCFTVSGQDVHAAFDVDLYFYCFRNYFVTDLRFTVSGLALYIDLFLLFQDKTCMLRVMQNVEKANGYVFGESDERTLHALMSCASGAEFEYEKIANIQEKHMDSSGEPMDSDDVT